MSSDCQMNSPVRFNRFLERHAVFTVDELDCHLTSRGSSNTNTRNSLLAYHRRQGRIVRVRRGLYATVPRGMDPASMTVDPYLVAAKITEDAVLAYHTALEFHGRGLLGPMASGLRLGAQVAPAHISIARVPRCVRATTALGEGRVNVRGRPA